MADFASRRSDLIREENAKPGDPGWMLTNCEVVPPVRFRSSRIEGYCSRTSAAAGESLEIFVSTNPPTPFTIDLYRSGWYGGAGARRVATLGPFRGEVQPDPPVGEKRLRECRWAPATRLTIPSDWPSGVYLGKLTAEAGGYQSYVTFVVCDRCRADFLFQCSTNTWQAYNRWPDHYALYDDGKNSWYWGPDVRVSYDRPYGRYCQIHDAPLSTGSGEWLLWEFPLAYWMEKEGYDVTYITNVDTHADPAGLLRGKAFLSVGHDEYWSPEMYASVRRAVDAGLNAAFLSANSVFGITPFAPSAAGVPDRILERVGVFAPREEEMVARFPTMARLGTWGPDGALLMGNRSVSPVTGGGDWICAKPAHWLFEGTGMRAGDGIPGIVGWEWHGAPAELPGLEVVATGPTASGKEKGTFAATIHPGPRGNHVFSAGTIWWSDGLAEPPGYLHPKAYGPGPQGPDPRVQRITRNLFGKFLA